MSRSAGEHNTTLKLSDRSCQVKISEGESNAPETAASKEPFKKNMAPKALPSKTTIKWESRESRRIHRRNCVAKENGNQK